MGTRRQKARTPQPTVRKRFIERGCKHGSYEGEFLDTLLAMFRQYCKVTEATAGEPSIRTKEFDSLKRRLETLRDQSAEIVAEIARERTKPRTLLSGQSLAVVLPRPYALEAQNLTDAIDKLERLAVRADTRAALIKLIFVYCRDAMNGALTRRELADLLEESTNHEITLTEESIRKAIARETRSPEEEWAFAHNLAGAAMRNDKSPDFVRRKLRSNNGKI